MIGTSARTSPRSAKLDTLVPRRLAVRHAGPGHELPAELRRRVLEVGPEVEGRAALQRHRGVEHLPSGARVGQLQEHIS